MMSDRTDHNTKSGRAGTLRCPTCLAPLEQKKLVVSCPQTCRHENPGSKRYGDHGLTDAGSQPRQQAWRCPGAAAGCQEVLTQVAPDRCRLPLTHPVAMPPDRLRHEVLIALGKRADTLHAGLAALASAACRRAPGAPHPALRPMTIETWRIWREAGMALRTLPLPPEWDGVRAPLVFGLPPTAEGWGFRLHLHGWALETLERKGHAGRPCAASAAERLRWADRIVLLVPAASAFEPTERETMTSEVQRLARALKSSGNGVPLPVCMCLLDQEELYRRLGSGAARPEQVAERDQAEARHVVQDYVRHSARLDALAAPLLRGEDSVIYAAAGAHGAPVGLAPWTEALRDIGGRTA